MCKRRILYKPQCIMYFLFLNPLHVFQGKSMTFPFYLDGIKGKTNIWRWCNDRLKWKKCTHIWYWDERGSFIPSSIYIYFEERGIYVATHACCEKTPSVLITNVSKGKFTNHVGAEAHEMLILKFKNENQFYILILLEHFRWLNILVKKEIYLFWG